jgi:hypothetical protein
MVADKKIAAAAKIQRSHCQRVQFHATTINPTTDFCAARTKYNSPPASDVQYPCTLVAATPGAPGLSMIRKSLPPDLIRGWKPVSRLRGARFGGRRKAGKIMLH